MQPASLCSCVQEPEYRCGGCAGQSPAYCQGTSNIVNELQILPCALFNQNRSVITKLPWSLSLMKQARMPFYLLALNIFKPHNYHGICIFWNNLGKCELKYGRICILVCTVHLVKIPLSKHVTGRVNFFKEMIFSQRVREFYCHLDCRWSSQLFFHLQCKICFFTHTFHFKPFVVSRLPFI